MDASFVFYYRGRAALRVGRLSLDECRWAFGDPLFGQSLSAAFAQEKIEDGHIGTKLLKRLPQGPSGGLPWGPLKRIS